MKKVLITLVIIMAIFLAFPLVGNKLIESTINDRVEVLASYGLEVKKSQTQNAYLSTKKHFIFKVQDSDKFVTYLNQFSDTQLPPYVDALVDGAEIGIDAKYSNIPLNDTLSLDIYPNAMPLQMVEKLKTNDIEFYKHLKDLLQNKTLVYHLNYDVINDSFDGYIKDINENRTLIDGTVLSLKLSDATFNGKGMLIAPDLLISNIKKFYLNVRLKDEYVNIDISDFTSSSVFESKTTYATTLKFNILKWDVKDEKETDFHVQLQNLALDFSSNTQSIKADFFAKTSLDMMKVKTVDTEINIHKFNYDSALLGVSTDSYEKLVSLISRAKLDSSAKLQKKIEITFQELISRGMILDIANLSIQDISTAKTKNLGALSIQSKIKFKQDRDLVKKLQMNPMTMLQTTDIELLFKVSKKIYAKLALISPVMSLAKNFAREDKNLIVFDIKL